MKFKSAKDSMYHSVFLGSFALILLISAFGLIWVNSSANQIAAFIFPGVLAPFLAWFYFGTYYEVKDQNLIINFGPFSQTLAKDRISSIRHIHSIYSAPALSCTRLQIRFDSYGETQISPEDEKGFLLALGRPLTEDTTASIL